MWRPARCCPVRRANDRLPASFCSRTSSAILLIPLVSCIYTNVALAPPAYQCCAVATRPRQKLDRTALGHRPSFPDPYCSGRREGPEADPSSTCPSPSLRCVRRTVDRFAWFRRFLPTQTIRRQNQALFNIQITNRSNPGSPRWQLQSPGPSHLPVASRLDH